MKIHCYHLDVLSIITINTLQLFKADSFKMYQNEKFKPKPNKNIHTIASSPEGSQWDSLHCIQ